MIKYLDIRSGDGSHYNLSKELVFFKITLYQINRYTLLGTNLFTLPSTSPAGYYTYEVPENERIVVKKGDIIAFNLDIESETRIDIPHVGCSDHVCLLFLSNNYNFIALHQT